MGHIVVVGSINMDLVMYVNRIPEIGETIHGESFVLSPGGKGANQAVAAVRMGSKVSFVGKVGADVFGKEVIENLKKFGIDCTNIELDATSSTGIAIITICKGDNSIMLNQGANYNIDQAYIQEKLDIITTADLVLIQNEIPISSVELLCQLLIKAKIKILFNPAPAANIKVEKLKGIDFFTPNETECEELSKIEVKDEEDAYKAIEFFLKMGVKYPIITMGIKGVAYYNGKDMCHVKAHKVNSIDTTAAGDTFSGAFGSCIVKGMSIDEAIIFANRAASITTTRKGAQNSIPSYEDIIYNFSKQ